MRLELDAAEWENASMDRRAFFTGCTRFNLGTPVAEYASYDIDGHPVGEPVRYVFSHPKITFEDAVRATESLKVPSVNVPRPVGDSIPDRAEYFAVVEDRLRPRDAEGRVTVDHIQAFKDQLTENADINKELRGRRAQKGAQPLPRVP